MSILANGVHLPLAAVPVDLGHDHSGMIAIAAEVVARNLASRRLVEQPAEGIFNVVESHTGEGVHREHEGFDVGRNRIQPDDDLFVVTFPSTRPIVAGVLQAAVLAAELAKPARVQQAASLVEHQAGGIQINVWRTATKTEEPLLLSRIPAEPHDHGPQFTSRLFLKRDFLTLC